MRLGCINRGIKITDFVGKIIVLSVQLREIIAQLRETEFRLETLITQCKVLVLQGFHFHHNS